MVSENDISRFDIASLLTENIFATSDKTGFYEAEAELDCTVNKFKSFWDVVGSSCEPLSSDSDKTAVCSTKTIASDLRLEEDGLLDTFSSHSSDRIHIILSNIDVPCKKVDALAKKVADTNIVLSKHKNNLVPNYNKNEHSIMVETSIINRNELDKNNNNRTDEVSVIRDEITKELNNITLSAEAFSENHAAVISNNSDNNRNFKQQTTHTSNIVKTEAVSRIPSTIPSALDLMIALQRHQHLLSKIQFTGKAEFDNEYTPSKPFTNPNHPCFAKRNLSLFYNFIGIFRELRTRLGKGSYEKLEKRTKIHFSNAKRFVEDALKFKSFIEDFDSFLENLEQFDIDSCWYFSLEFCFKKSVTKNDINLYTWFKKRMHQRLSWHRARIIMERAFGFDAVVTKNVIRDILFNFKQGPDQPFVYYFEIFSFLANAGSTSRKFNYTEAINIFFTNIYSPTILSTIYGAVMLNGIFATNV